MKDWLARLHTADRLMDAALPMLGQLLAAIAIFLIGKWVAEWLIKLVRLAMQRGRMDETLADFLGNVLYGLALTIVVISALHQLGVDTTSAAAVLGGAALAIGLSLQQQLSSLAAGVILIIFRPFKKGDYVEIGASGATVKGVVEEIKIVHTRLRTADNREVMVPNSSITTNTIINYSTRQLRRIELVINIGYEADLRLAKQVLLEILDGEKQVLKDPAPLVEVKDLSASSVDFNVWGWAKTADYQSVRAKLLETIKLRFDREGINMPYPQMDLHVKHLPDAPKSNAPAPVKSVT
ncbi:MAG: mechanosensitive ion channel family protein [Stenotrophobium sp.]